MQSDCFACFIEDNMVTCHIVYKTKAVFGLYCPLALCIVIPDGGSLFCDTNIHPGYDLTFL